MKEKLVGQMDGEEFDSLLERQTAGVRDISSDLTYMLKRPLHPKSDA